MRRILCAFFLVALTWQTAPARAAETSEQQKVVDAARTALEQLRTDNAMGESARNLIHKARAVMIVPRLVKAGFFLGGHGGSGVLLGRSSAGWSSPCFYGMGGGSIGLQIGGEVSRVVLIIMSDKALDAVMKDEFKVGAAAGITVVTLGASGEASTTANAGADIYAVAQSKGFYGGIALEGAIMSPRDSWNKEYYRRDVTVQDIVVRNSVGNPGAAALRSALAKF
ncbi:MAG TPA: lipid-binding SYLF domain-containing protein [Stellaceae bacterium]|nr:lipid-binding SYLF domain-containing protein [Stellaceae bacterium]